MFENGLVMSTPTSLGAVSPVPLTGQNYIDSLLACGKWGGSIGTSASLTYSFRTNSFNTEGAEELAANADINAQNIGLVGLQQSGVEFV